MPLERHLRLPNVTTVGIGYLTWTCPSGGLERLTALYDCVVCGVKFQRPSGSHRITCSEECAKERGKQIRREYAQRNRIVNRDRERARRREEGLKSLKPRPCIGCQTVFTPGYGAGGVATRKFCSDYCRKKTRRTARYGLTVQEYDALARAQGGVCAACGKPPTDHELAVDHCHAAEKTTGEIVVRGLLHRTCNAGIGWAYEDQDVLFGWSVYLARQQLDLRDLCD